MNIKKFIVGPVRTNCYVVYEKNEAVIIDPGDEGFDIYKYIEDNNLKVKAILLTHGHFDHVGAVTYIKEKTNAKVYVSKEEKELLQVPAINLSTMMGELISIFGDIYLEDNDTIEVLNTTIKVIATPGHTIGSVCYYFQDKNILFSGDTLFYQSHGRTDFPTGSESQIIKSIKNKLMVLPKETVVYPGHECATTIKDEVNWY